jgi:transcriptional regulator with XRE-family HTH domain
MAEITAGQLRAARELMGWSLADLAKAAAIRTAAVTDFESGARAPYRVTVTRLRAAFEAEREQIERFTEPSQQRPARSPSGIAR